MRRVNGYILAGGKSSRMGMDKGLMLLNEKPMVQYVIDQLQPVVNRIVIVSNNPEYEKFGFEVIVDLIKDIGPAGGIYAALNHSHENRNFIVSCDMPFITSATIKYIIENAIESEITLPVYRQNIEPLFAVYSKECLEKWKELIEQGIVKLHNLVEHFNLLKINVDSSEMFNDQTFRNINTRNDFEDAKRK